ncbi:MAG TPA: hypothetical protein VEC57_17345 [Candidatus Limnocylindrales bacterium]|nr:hypothetical protein [Candidatus Limnocylindrales bacterium]
MCSLIVSLFAPPTGAYAAPGDLDTTFSTDGITTQTFSGTGNQTAYAVAVDGNGKIVVAGEKLTSPGTGAIARFNADGTLDTTFSTDGLQTVIGGCSSLRINAILIDASNRIVFAGRCGTDFLLGRLTNSGNLDTTFGPGGAGAISPTDFDGFAQALAVQPDGKYVVAGLVGPSTVRVARFTANGSIDTTFDSDGTMTHSFLNCDAPEIRGVGVQSDGTGRIVAVGFGICDISSVTGDAVIMLFLTSNGSLDSSAFGDGVKVDRFGLTEARAHAMSFGPSTKVTIAGTTTDSGGNTDFFLARTTSFGITDNTFGTSGRVVTDFGANSEANAVRVHSIDASNVLIVAGGLVDNAGNQNFAVARYGTTGALDTTFSGDGKVTTDFGSSADDRIFSAALQPADLKLVVAGGSIASGTDRFAVARYLMAQCGNGTVEPGEDCETGACCNTSTCRFQPAATTCRGAAGVCDVAETCSGTSAACPADALAPSSTVCRAGNGTCDPAENCTGSSVTCPANTFASSGTACTDDGQACTADQCDGAGTCTHPLRPANTVCRAAASSCDVAEVCNGTSGACPANGFQPSGTACAADSNPCTLDQCDGAGTCAHPAGNAGTVCRAAANACDVAETCSGASTTCPANGFAGSGTPCASNNVFCDGVEQCNGAGSCISPGNPCTGGAFCANLCNESQDTCNRPAGTACTSDGQFCTGVEQCNGSGACVSPGDPCPAQDICFVCNTATQQCVDTDPDGDGHCLAADTCPTEFNPDQLNTDCPDPDFFALGGCDDPSLVPDGRKGCCDGGDVCDPCPANAINERCDQDISGGQSIGPNGGSFTLGNCITISVPAGALATDTSISVSVGEDDPINPATGQPFSDPIKLKGGTTSVMKIIMLPDDQTFAAPITIELCWDDRDNDNVVDKGVCIDNGACTEVGEPSCDANGDCACGNCVGGGATQEDNLRLRRDGELFDHEGFHPAPLDECGDVHQQNTAFCSAAAAPGNCADTPGTGRSSVANCCNRTANKWPFQTCYFSEFYFGRLEGALIPGRGSLATDCQSEWSVVNPFNEPESDKRGFLNLEQTCTDGDPSCDGDGLADGACTFQVAVCLNVDDARLSDAAGVQLCDPSDTATWELKKPLPISARPHEADAALALRDAVAALGGGTVGGSRQNIVTFATPLLTEDMCTETTQIVVPLSGPLADRATRMTFKAAATSAGGSKDSDLLKLNCIPPSDE